MNSAIILCNSLVGVANKILKCEIPEGDLFCFQTDTTPEYLIISDCASLDVYKEIQNGENFQKRSVQQQIFIQYVSQSRNVTLKMQKKNI